MEIMSIDVETSSPVNLTLCGSDVYTGHLSTRVLMVGYHRVGSPAPPQLWLEGYPPPQEIIDHIATGGGLTGWNVMTFDRYIWDRKLVPLWGFPRVDPDFWQDSMYLAAHENRPRSLDAAAKSVHLPVDTGLKDKNMIRAITDSRRTIIPASVGHIFANPNLFDPELVQKLYWLANRCLQDVWLEENTLVRLKPWPAVVPWISMPYVNRRINDRGMRLDIPTIDGLLRAATVKSHEMHKAMFDITGGAVDRYSRIGLFKDWLIYCGVKLPLKIQKQDDEDREQTDEDDPDDDPRKDNRNPYRLRRNDVADIIADPATPYHCRVALEIRQEAGKASLSKLKRMLAAVGADGRLRNAFMLGGAQQTLRWSATLVQVHNLVRDVFANPDEIEELFPDLSKRNKAEFEYHRNRYINFAVEIARTGDIRQIEHYFTRDRLDAQNRSYVQGPITFISRMMRLMIMAAPGFTLLNGDYAQIEARIPMWLAGQLDKLHAFARGEDMYRKQAAPVFTMAPEQLTKFQRQIGKVMSLSCGFAGGAGAFVPMAMNYGIRMTRQEAQPFIDVYRADNPFLVTYWNNLVSCAHVALDYPGRVIQVGPGGHIAWIYQDNCLQIILPSGRRLTYWAPERSYGTWADGTPKDYPDITVLTVKGTAVFRRTLWRGLIIENITQAIETDFLANALMNLDRENLPVVIHVHDNAGAEVPEDHAEDLMPLFKQCMADVPPWAAGLPIAVDAEIGVRFS